MWQELGAIRASASRNSPAARSSPQGGYREGRNPPDVPSNPAISAVDLTFPKVRASPLGGESVPAPVAQRFRVDLRKPATFQMQRKDAKRISFALQFNGAGVVIGRIPCYNQMPEALRWVFSARDRCKRVIFSWIRCPNEERRPQIHSACERLHPERLVRVRERRSQ